MFVSHNGTCCFIDIKPAPKSALKFHTGVNKGNGVLLRKCIGKIVVMVPFLDLVLGGIRVILLIRDKACLFESLEYLHTLK